MVSGESHYFLGRRYRLRVVTEDGRLSVTCRQSTLEMKVRPGAAAVQRERILQEWYRWQLKHLIPPLVSKWQGRSSGSGGGLGCEEDENQMGICNTKARRIWLNLVLAKVPVHCLEYVVVHELVHLIERRHNERFRHILDQHMPQWRAYRPEMNRAPLAHETWTF